MRTIGDVYKLAAQAMMEIADRGEFTTIIFIRPATERLLKLVADANGVNDCWQLSPDTPIPDCATDIVENFVKIMREYAPDIKVEV